MLAASLLQGLYLQFIVTVSCSFAVNFRIKHLSAEILHFTFSSDDGLKLCMRNVDFFFFLPGLNLPTFPLQC